MLGCRKLNTKSPFHGSNSVRQIVMQSSWPLWQTKKSIFEKEGLANSTCKTTASSIQWWNSNSQSLARESPPITTRSMATILMPTTNLLKLGQPRPLFVYFRSFQQQFYRKNCRLQRESNSDRWSRRRARWPLDHHHSPKQIYTRKTIQYLCQFLWQFMAPSALPKKLNSTCLSWLYLSIDVYIWV